MAEWLGSLILNYLAHLAVGLNPVRDSLMREIERASLHNVGGFI
jgi:hypothetical protein